MVTGYKLHETGGIEAGADASMPTRSESTLARNEAGAVNPKIPDFVFSLNDKRRQMTSSQKATCAVNALPFYEKQAKKKQVEAGGDRKSEEYAKSVVEKIPQAIDPENKSRNHAAEQFGTNPRYVSDAKKLKQDEPETFGQITNELAYIDTIL